MKLRLTLIAVVALVLSVAPAVSAAGSSGSEGAASQAGVVASPDVACVVAASTSAESGSRHEGGFLISDQRCTADDCRVCNENGLVCTPEGDECYCDPVIIILGAS
jgi:hypothetical protein